MAARRMWRRCAKWSRSGGSFESWSGFRFISTGRASPGSQAARGFADALGEGGRNSGGSARRALDEPGRRAFARRIEGWSQEAARSGRRGCGDVVVEDLSGASVPHPRRRASEPPHNRGHCGPGRFRAARRGCDCGESALGAVARARVGAARDLRRAPRSQPGAGGARPRVAWTGPKRGRAQATRPLSPARWCASSR